MSIQYLIGPILSKKSCQKMRVWKKDKNGGGGHIAESVYRKGDSKFPHTIFPSTFLFFHFVHLFSDELN